MREATLLVVAQDLLELHAQFGEAIAYLAAIDLEIGLARADPLLPTAAGDGLLQARRDVLQPRDLHLNLGFPAARMAMKDLHDYAGPVEHLGTGCALEIARLGRRELVIDDHELRLWRRLRIRLDRERLRLSVAGVHEALTGLRVLRDGHRSDDSSPAGHRRKLREAPLAEQGPTAGPGTLLRQRADDLVSEGFHETAQFLEARGVGDIVDARDLNADQDRARDRQPGFHD